MLEIIVLWQLCKSLGRMLRDKGRKPRPFQILLVVMWFGGEFAVGIVAGAVQVVRHGQLDSGLDPTVYLSAILGAACGAGITFLIARQLSPIAEEQPADFGEVSAVPLLPGDLVPSDNPYQSPFADAAYGAPQDPQQPRTSGFAVASLVVGVVSGLLEVGLVTAATIAVMNGPRQPTEPMLVILGFGILAGLGLGTLGVILGLIGLLQGNRGRILPVLALLLNALVVVAVCGLMALGWAGG